jgi:hypothetical protein
MTGNLSNKKPTILSPWWLAICVAIGVLSMGAYAQTDIALNKPATASSVEKPGTEPGKAVDGDPTTRWASAFSDPQWIQVDLGATYTISGVALVWEAASAKNYTIDVSATGSGGWATIATKTNMPAGARTDNITGLAGSGRYIRMYGTARTTNYGYSLYTFSVYGTTGTQYILTVQNDGNGTVSPSSVSVSSGVPTPISATANTGYTFKNWSVVSGSATFGNANSASTTATLSGGSATIRASFTPNTPASANAVSYIALATPVNVTNTTTILSLPFTAPAAGYVVVTVTGLYGANSPYSNEQRGLEGFITLNSTAGGTLSGFGEKAGLYGGAQYINETAGFNVAQGSNTLRLIVSPRSTLTNTVYKFTRCSMTATFSTVKM